MMPYWLLCLIVFIGAYLLNILYVTVFYHRALAHAAIKLRPGLERFVVHTGNWLTGIDPKAWICMHRMHHTYSDDPKDPHSPMVYGVFGVMLGQLHSYQRTLKGLIGKKSTYTSLVKDLDFPVSWLNRNGYWYMPYLVHAVIALAIGLYFHAVLLAVCYWVGIMSHPIQGWMVNSLAHKFGYRNFETTDNSRNNTMVALLVFGEGFQNNHHQFPSNAKFSVKWWEIDMGYGVCRILKLLGGLANDKPSLPTAVPVPA